MLRPPPTRIDLKHEDMKELQALRHKQKAEAKLVAQTPDAAARIGVGQGAGGAAARIGVGQGAGAGGAGAGAGGGMTNAAVGAGR